MLGRQVAFVLRARLPRCIPGQSSSGDLTAARIIISRIVRHYATPGRPRTAVGEPSKPVKRAVKRAAAKPATATEGASTAPKAAKTKTKTTKAKTSVASKAKKVAPKKRALTPEQQQIKTEKAQARAEKTKARAQAAKEKIKARAVKTKARAKKVQQKDDIAQLKKTALEPPKLSTANAFLMFSGTRMQEAYSGESKPSATRNVITNSKELSRKFSEEWKNMAPADIEHWNHESRTRKEASAAEYKRWVESHTPEAIQTANNARHLLNRKFPPKSGKLRKWRPIQDERQAKRPRSSFLQFSLARQATGDYANIKLLDRAKLLGQEWHELSSEEKKKYNDLGQEDSQRYAAEHSSVYKSPPPSYAQHIPQDTAAAAAAAA